MSNFTITRISNKTTGGGINVSNLSLNPPQTLSIDQNHHLSPKWPIGDSNNPTELQMGYDDPGSELLLAKLYLDGDDLYCSYSSPINKKVNLGPQSSDSIALSIQNSEVDGVVWIGNAGPNTH